MIRIRWLKVIRDIWRNRGRTFTVTLALAVGIYSIGVILDARELLGREYSIDRETAKQSSVVIVTLPFDVDLADRVEEISGVAATEGRMTVRSHVTLENGERKELKIQTISDFEDIDVDRITRLSGNFPPTKNEILLERLGLQYLQVSPGEFLTVEFEGGNLKVVQIGGVIHDPLQYAPRLNHTTQAYVTLAGMENLGFGSRFDEMHIRLDENLSKDEVYSVVEKIEKQIENSGRLIITTNIKIDNPVDSIIDTVILMLTIMGWVIFLLAGFLVVNAISALITQQVQQIGIMKLVGANRRQIIGMYLVNLLFFGIVSAFIGIPLAIFTAQLLITELIQDLINILPDSLMIPFDMILFQIIVALLLPIGAGLLPVLRGTKLTTLEALNDIGLQKEKTNTGLLERIIVQLQKFRPLKRTYLLAARNALRHKGRLALTLFVLILGTALFISVISVNSSVNLTLDKFLNYHQYDVSVEMARPYRIEKMEAIANEVPMVQDVESWTISGVKRLREDDQESNIYRLYAIPANSDLISPQVIKGKWLIEGERFEVVINSDVFDEEPDLEIGDEIHLEINGYETIGQLVGVVRTDSQGPSIYIHNRDYADITNTRGKATHIQIVASPEGQKKQAEIETALFQAFESAGMEIVATKTSGQINQRNHLMFTIIIAVLIMMALLLAGVGGLGLSTTMNINILERVREIGILRAIGASNFSVRKIILIEGLFIGAISWLIGTMVSVPVSFIFSEQVGLSLLKVPLIFNYSMLAMVFWLFAVLLIAIIASLGPAQKAEKLTIREVLAYE
jgi:putative ABC transport system permease protein